VLASEFGASSPKRPSSISAESLDRFDEVRFGDYMRRKWRIRDDIDRRVRALVEELANVTA